jgi:hypothetical protein
MNMPMSLAQQDYETDEEHTQTPQAPSLETEGNVETPMETPEYETWITYYDNWQKKTEGQHADGMFNGTWTRWYKNGQIQMQGNMQNGKKIGIWTIWNEQGKIIFFEYYSNGKLVKQIAK